MTKRHKQKCLFLDIETSFGLYTAWRTGTKVNLSIDNIVEERKIIMVSWKWGHEDKVHNVTWKKDLKSKDKYLPFCDKNVMEKIIEQMDKADMIVGHNGKSFDIRFIRAHAMRHGIPMNHTYPIYDTLTHSRRLLNTQSHKLDYLGGLYVGEHKLETGGYGLWKKVCLQHDRKALKLMVNYCNQDVLLLEKFYNKLTQYSASESHVGVLDGQPRYSCPTCGSHDIKLNKERITAAGIPRYTMKCAKGHHYTISDFVYKLWIKER